MERNDFLLFYKSKNILIEIIQINNNLISNEFISYFGNYEIYLNNSISIKLKIKTTFSSYFLSSSNSSSSSSSSNSSPSSSSFPFTSITSLNSSSEIPNSSSLTLNSNSSSSSYATKISSSNFISSSNLILNFLLDIQTHILLKNVLEDSNILKSYIVTRFNERYVMNIIKPDNDINEDLQNDIDIFDFFLQQFCRYTVQKSVDLEVTGDDDNYNNIDSNNINQNQQDNSSKKSHAEEKRKVNAVAKGAESTGFFLRKELKEGGKSAGDVIRYINHAIPVHHEDHHHHHQQQQQQLEEEGENNNAHNNSLNSSDNQYESTSLLNSENNQSKIRLTEAQIAAEEKRAEYYKQQAEIIHSYTKTATSAIMLPIRMMGRKAVELAQPNPQEEDGWKKAVMDTVGGCGNRIMSIAKGFTEVNLYSY